MPVSDDSFKNQSAPTANLEVTTVLLTLMATDPDERSHPAESQDFGIENSLQPQSRHT